jgi:hypothetical protein
MSEQDRMRMVKTAAQKLPKKLKNLFGDTIEFKNELVPVHLTYVDGYKVTIASVPRVDPDLEIVVCLEATKDQRRQWFWAGFFSGIAQPIRRLEKACPSRLRYKNTTNSYESKAINGYWYYRDGASDEISNIRITIEYHKDIDNAFGVYSKNHGKLDLNESVKFVRDRFFSLP